MGAPDKRSSRGSIPTPRVTPYPVSHFYVLQILYTYFSSPPPISPPKSYCPYSPEEGNLILTMPPSLKWTTSRMETIPRWVTGKPGNPTPLRRFVLIVIWGRTPICFPPRLVRVRLLAPTTPAASIAPNDTNTAATNAPNTLLQSAPKMNSSLSAELRALALQRESIDARLNDQQTPGYEGGHGGPDPIPPDEVRRLRKKRGKITAREQKLLNRAQTQTHTINSLCNNSLLIK
ncbi:hypothetical protein ACJJTC_012843 [Scirpophaga incertulas]